MTALLGIHPVLLVGGALVALVITGSLLYEHAQDKAAMRDHANRMADDPYWAGHDS